jgi:hypothetical protein
MQLEGDMRHPHGVCGGSTRSASSAASSAPRCDMSDWIAGFAPKSASMESTGIYWKSPYAARASVWAFVPGSSTPGTQGRRPQDRHLHRPPSMTRRQQAKKRRGTLPTVSTCTCRHGGERAYQPLPGADVSPAPPVTCFRVQGSSGSGAEGAGPLGRPSEHFGSGAWDCCCSMTGLLEVRDARLITRGTASPAATTESRNCQLLQLAR